MHEVALLPFQQKILDELYFLAKHPAHELLGRDEVEDMVNCLKLHIHKLHSEIPQERVQKTKYDERRIEIKIPNIK